MNTSLTGPIKLDEIYAFIKSVVTKHNIDTHPILLGSVKDILGSHPANNMAPVRYTILSSRGWLHIVGNNTVDAIDPTADRNDLSKGYIGNAFGSHLLTDAYFHPSVYPAVEPCRCIPPEIDIYQVSTDREGNIDSIVGYKVGS